MSITDNPLYEALETAWERGRDDVGLQPTSNVILRLGETLRFCAGVQGTSDFYDTLGPGVDNHYASEIANVMVHAGEFGRSAVESAFNRLSRLVESGDASMALQAMVVIAANVSRKDDALLDRLLAAQADCQRAVLFQNQFGGPSLTQINESQWLRLVEAGATHVALNKDESVTQSVFYNSTGTTEVGRFTAHQQSAENESDIFKLKKVNHIFPEGLITPIPPCVFDVGLHQHLHYHLNSKNPPARLADLVVSELHATNQKQPFVTTASVAIYQYLTEKFNQMDSASAIGVLGYIAHYANEKLSQNLMRSIGSIPLQTETDYTVGRGIKNTANTLANQMLDAKAVFSRRHEAVDSFRNVMDNPSIDVSQKIAIAASTLQFANQDVAQWLAHGYSQKPQAENNPDRPKMTM